MIDVIVDHHRELAGRSHHDIRAIESGHGTRRHCRAWPHGPRDGSTPGKPGVCGRCWTRSGIAADLARDLRITAHTSAADMVAASDIVLLSLSDDAAVTEVVGQLVRGDLAGKLIVDTSTVSPDTLRRLSGAISEAGARRWMRQSPAGRT
jgi:hypothetical protein